MYLKMNFIEEILTKSYKQHRYVFDRRKVIYNIYGSFYNNINLINILSTEMKIFLNYDIQNVFLIKNTFYENYVIEKNIVDKRDSDGCILIKMNLFEKSLPIIISISSDESIRNIEYNYNNICDKTEEYITNKLLEHQLETRHNAFIKYDKYFEIKYIMIGNNKFIIDNRFNDDIICVNNIEYLFVIERK